MVSTLFFPRARNEEKTLKLKVRRSENKGVRKSAKNLESRV